MKKSLHVAVGVIQDGDGRILIARRPQHLHQGGLWEFPGGKVEPGEDVNTALRRELQEELGIGIGQTEPLISLEHDYGDRQVWLDVHRVLDFSGTAHGREGQAVDWVAVDKLSDYEFPAANRAILNAIRLPDRYMITAEFPNEAEYLHRVQAAAQQGVRLIQLRAKHLADRDYLALAKQVEAVQADKVMVLLNTSPEMFAQTSAAGLHLSSQRLMQLQHRPIPLDKLLSVSVHTEQELKQANRIGVDLLLVSPVMPTASHPEAIALSWERFGELAARANCPVYALGGMSIADISVAKRYGAQGVAGIGLFEKTSSRDN
ncbi:MAG: Nudix family hydrolase [Gammaproteobacteria bacterium]|jgi:8-oxo-dGTP diphosphatase